MSAPALPDPATLAWIAAEVGAALPACASALLDTLLPAPAHLDDGAMPAAEPGAESSTTPPGAADAAALRQARLHFSRARHAIALAPLAPLERLFDACEALFAGLPQAALAARREAVLALADAFHAAAAYLEQLKDGTAPSPLRLLPYLSTLRVLADAPAATPAALFFPDLSLLASFAGTPAGGPALAPNEWRARFEQGLLPCLTGRMAPPAALAPAVVLGAIADAQTDNDGRARWSVLRAVAELAAPPAGQAPALEHKRLLGLIHAQVRRLPAPPEDDALGELLYALAAAPALPPLGEALAHHCRLASLLVDDPAARHYDSALDYAPVARPDAGASWQDEVEPEDGHELAPHASIPDAGELAMHAHATDTPGTDMAGVITAAIEAPPAHAPAPAAPTQPAVAPMSALADELSASLAALLEESRRPLAPAPEPDAHGSLMSDAFDAQRLPALLEHGGMLLTQIGHYLKAWRQAPDDAALAPALTSLLCALQEHASAAGALRLTLALYELELPIGAFLAQPSETLGAAPSQLFDTLLAHYAECMRLFEQLPHAGTLQVTA